MGPEPTVLHDDCQRLARALEGVAGALHDGRRVDREDLETAAQAASWVWEAGPEPASAQAHEFEAARSEMVRLAASAAAGMPRECGRVELAAHRLAQSLRWMAHVAMQVPGRRDEPAKARPAITRLAARYARHSPWHPAAA